MSRVDDNGHLDSVYFSQPAPEAEQWPSLKTVLLTLHPKKGDIWVVDGTQLDVNNLCELKLPEVTWRLPVIATIPKPGSTVEEAIRTCDLPTLKRIVAEMEQEIK